MNLSQALDTAHQAKRINHDTSCTGYCLHCAVIVLAAELAERMERAPKPRSALRQGQCPCCRTQLVDGLCANCDC